MRSKHARRLLFSTIFTFWHITVWSSGVLAATVVDGITLTTTTTVPFVVRGALHNNKNAFVSANVAAAGLAAVTSTTNTWRRGSDSVVASYNANSPAYSQQQQQVSREQQKQREEERGADSQAQLRYDAATSSSKPQQQDAQRETQSQTEKPLKSCEEWRELFKSLNHFFRDDDILKGSDHSSLLAGYAICAAYSVVITFGAIGNLLTIIAVCRNPQMHTVRNFFILNLALSDFFICTVTAPITLYTVLYTFWPFGTSFCKIVGSLQGFNIFLSTFSITAIALDRYVLVIFPTQRDRQKNLALIFFLLIWLISVLLALPLFAASDLDSVFRDQRCDILLTICHEQNLRWKQMALSKEMYTVGVLVIQYAFPLASIVFAYSRIARRMGTRFAPRNSFLPAANAAVHNKKSATAMRSAIVRDSVTAVNNSDNFDCASLIQQQQQGGRQLSQSHVHSQPYMLNGGGSFCSNHSIQNNNTNNNNSNNKANGYSSSAQFERVKRSKDRHRRTNLLLIVIVCVFAAAWLPLNIFHLYNTFHTTHRFSVTIFALCHCLAIGSACLNPLSYAFFNYHFRAEFVAIFKTMRLIWLYRYFANCSRTIRVHRSSNVKVRAAKKRSVRGERRPTDTLISPPISTNNNNNINDNNNYAKTANEPNATIASYGSDNGGETTTIDVAKEARALAASGVNDTKMERVDVVAAFTSSDESVRDEDQMCL